MRTSTNPPPKYRHLVEDFIRLPELARKLQMDRKTVRQILEGAGIRKYVFGENRNSSVRYCKSDVDKLLERCLRKHKDVG